MGGVRVAALAWLLSLVARENRRGQRAAWIAAYIGLPLLYAAFNTFPGVHDVVLRGFPLVSGGTAGSPLDPTDSLVIPVGLGIALWVWRRGAVAPGDLRRRLTALTAGVAVVASVATSMAEPGYGVTHIWTVEPSTTVADLTGGVCNGIAGLWLGGAVSTTTRTG